MASITRAFTTRRHKKSLDISPPIPQRSVTNAKHLHSTGSIRDMISAPVELISTTNMLSYSAPDLYPTASNDKTSKPPSLVHSSSASSLSSDTEQSPTRSVDTAASGLSTAPTSPGNDELSAVKEVETNHLSCYFGKRSSSLGQENVDEQAPGVPQRKLSHTKSTHEVLAHSRSASRLSTESKDSRIAHSFKNSVSSFARDSLQMLTSLPDLVESRAESGSVRSRPRPIISAPLDPATYKDLRSRSRGSSLSDNHHSSASTPQSRLSSQNFHPFGAELAQVTELAEEFATTLISPPVQVMDEEEAELQRSGLYKFAAQEYLAEIESCYVKAYGPRRMHKSTESWI